VQHLPRILGVRADTDDPPKLVAVVPVRKGARNPVDYKPDTAAEQKRGFPDIVPLLLDEAPGQAYERAERAARAMGWEIVAAAPQALRIEATDTTLLFGFKDDGGIRITPRGQGSVVDVRSLSRVGGSDFGVNAKRIRVFLAKLSASQKGVGCACQVPGRDAGRQPAADGTAAACRPGPDASCAVRPCARFEDHSNEGYPDARPSDNVHLRTATNERRDGL